jgi:DNA (cytosine-5)-methyltransferase 1
MRPPAVRLFDDEAIIDGFAGGGGASTGIEMALGRSPSIAINHDKIALAMHEANHPATRHIPSNIRRVRYEKEVPAAQRVAVAWFSPDCTHHSKARGGKPFRDPLKARRIRGLAWEAVRCAKALHAATAPGEASRAPRVIILENVEEWRDWCPLLADGTPDWSKRGANCRRWKREMAKAGPGYVIEERELVACDYGDPTKRKRLFIICRSDGKPIVWPEPTHGPGRPNPYRTAAECIDFSLPVPSIFLTQKQAYAWAKANGLPKASAPRRPLATATKRRIARGVFRYVINEPQPFIVNTRHTGYERDLRTHSIDEPIVTIPASDREHALVAPFFAPYYTERVEERHARTRGVNEPLPTITTQGGGKVALIAPVLVGVGGRKGQSPETPVTRPYHTITAKGDTALVAAFLAKHNAGHEATGQRLGRPIDTVTTKDSKALVTSHLLKLRGGLADHQNTAQDLRQPAPTQTAGGTHYAEVRITLVPKESLDASYVERAVKTCAFLVKYFRTGIARPLDRPLDTITTRDRVGLVEVILVKVGDSEWVLADICMRMLTPRELFLCQGFPAGYEITTVPVVTAGMKVLTKLTKKAQTRLVGNSVPPNVAASLIRANVSAPAQRQERLA